MLDLGGEVGRFREFREAEDRQQALPLAGLQGRGEIADVDQEIGIDQQEPGDVLGAFDVAGHPVHGVGIAGKHGALGLGDRGAEDSDFAGGE